MEILARLWALLLEGVAGLGIVLAFVVGLVAIAISVYIGLGLAWLVNRGRDAWIAKHYQHLLEAEIRYRMRMGHSEAEARRRGLVYLRKREHRE